MSKETNKKTGKKTKTRIIICERCGKEVLTTACHQKYCKECMKEVKIESKRRYIRSRLLKKHENMPLELLKWTTAVCPVCGNKWKVKTQWKWTGRGKMRKICDNCRGKVPYRFYETVRIGGVVT